jgi:hypothetical protein
MEIEAAAADPAPWIEGDNAPLTFALVLLGHCRVLEAHDTLLRLAALPNDDAEALLDDKTLAHADEQADSLDISEKDLDRVLAEGRSSALAAARERAARRFPESIHGYLVHWASFQSPAGGLDHLPSL